MAEQKGKNYDVMSEVHAADLSTDVRAVLQEARDIVPLAWQHVLPWETEAKRDGALVTAARFTRSFCGHSVVLLCIRP